MKTTLAIVWLVTLIHFTILGVTSGYADQCEREVEQFIVKSNK